MVSPDWIKYVVVKYQRSKQFIYAHSTIASILVFTFIFHFIGFSINQLLWNTTTFDFNCPIWVRSYSLFVHTTYITLFSFVRNERNSNTHELIPTSVNGTVVQCSFNQNSTVHTLLTLVTIKIWKNVYILMW